MDKENEGLFDYPVGEETLDDLVAQGRVIPPTKELFEVLSTPPIPAGSPTLSEILEEMRRNSR